MEDTAFRRDQQIIQSLFEWDVKMETVGTKFSTNLDDYASSSEEEEEAGQSRNTNDEEELIINDGNEEERLKKKLQLQEMLDMECTIFDKLLESLQGKANMEDEEDMVPEPCTASLENETLTVQDKSAVVSFSITKSILQQWEEEMREKIAMERATTNNNNAQDESNTDSFLETNDLPSFNVSEPINPIDVHSLEDQ
jgi:hypothetical protein